MPDFVYQDMLPIGADETPYRLLTADYVSTFEAGGRRFLQVDPEALTLLTKTAMFEIAHLLRPGHLAQLASILDDPYIRGLMAQALQVAGVDLMTGSGQVVLKSKIAR